ncbi:hypothetical protein VTL71DRAFT_5774 [Oculimacula yallundae]|uniref:BTB domain-containing protein n=1 Tax=Oculimacula yallundae TaxID=86028 RepID=A0ABR4BZF6_9HELO
MASITALMFATDKYSDLLIKCKGKEFKVHRIVVCLQSKPLAAAVDGKFKEAITGEIDLDGNEPGIVQYMLQFMYTQDYTDSALSKRIPASSGMTGSAALLVHTKLYIIGDQLDIQPLKALAKNKYEATVSEFWNSDSFVTSLELLYKETSEDDRLLKEIAVKVAGQHVKELCDRGDFVALCKANGEIGFDVLNASIMAKADLIASMMAQAALTDSKAAAANALKVCPWCYEEGIVGHYPEGRGHKFTFFCHACSAQFN